MDSIAGRWTHNTYEEQAGKRLHKRSGKIANTAQLGKTTTSNKVEATSPFLTSYFNPYFGSAVEKKTANHITRPRNI